MMRSAVAAGALAAGALLAFASSGACRPRARNGIPFTVEEHNPPFDMASPVKEVCTSR